MISRAPIPELPDARGLTRERFEAVCMERRAPVVLRGLVAHWDWVGRTPSNVVAEWPSRAIHTHGISVKDTTTEKLELTRADIARQLAPDPVRRRGDGLIIDVEAEAPELLPRFPSPDVHGGVLRHLIFMGHDTITDTHYHLERHNLICQVLGRKRLLLHSPEDFRHLYPPSVLEGPQFNRSRADVSAPDLETFPLLAKSRPLETVLDPGDALFIPVHWWHTVYGVGPVMSVSFFWKARLTDHRFPYPAVRNVAGALRWRVLSKLSSWFAARSPSGVTPVDVSDLGSLGSAARSLAR
jgi:hypothetical protein